MKILCSNFNFYKNPLEYDKYESRFIELLKNQDDVDIVAGQEIPPAVNSKWINKKVGKDSKVIKPKNSRFFTGYIIYEKDLLIECTKYEDRDNIWKKSNTYPCIVPQFEKKYWSEIVVNFEGKDIRIINVHVSITNNIMIKQTLIYYISKLSDEYCIIMGDFNAAEKKDTEKYFRENDRFLKLIQINGFEELVDNNEKGGTPHFTRYDKDGGRKLDHIFVSDKLYDEFKCEIEYIDEINYTYRKYDLIDKRYIYTGNGFTDHSGMKLIISNKIK